jgi:hypothetical protein
VIFFFIQLTNNGVSLSHGITFIFAQKSKSDNLLALTKVTVCPMIEKQAKYTNGISSVQMDC